MQTGILLALLISVLASATNTELSNNTNFLLLLLLALGAYNRNSCCNSCNQTCLGSTLSSII